MYFKHAISCEAKRCSWDAIQTRKRASVHFRLAAEPFRQVSLDTSCSFSWASGREEAFRRSFVLSLFSQKLFQQKPQTHQGEHFDWFFSYLQLPTQEDEPVLTPWLNVVVSYFIYLNSKCFFMYYIVYACVFFTSWPEDYRWTLTFG